MTGRSTGRRAADRRDLDKFLVRLATGECEAPAYEVADDGRLTRTVACEKCLPCRAGKVLRWAGLIDEIAVRVTDLSERRERSDRRRIAGSETCRTYPDRRRRDRRAVAASRPRADSPAGRHAIVDVRTLRHSSTLAFSRVTDRAAPAPRPAGAALTGLRLRPPAGGAR